MRSILQRFHFPMPCLRLVVRLLIFKYFLRTVFFRMPIAFVVIKLRKSQYFCLANCFINFCTVNFIYKESLDNFAKVLQLKRFRCQNFLRVSFLSCLVQNCQCFKDFSQIYVKSICLKSVSRIGSAAAAIRVSKSVHSNCETHLLLSIITNSVHFELSITNCGTHFDAQWNS